MNATLSVDGIIHVNACINIITVSNPLIAKVTPCPDAGGIKKTSMTE
jgi:hypothetical protein